MDKLSPLDTFDKSDKLATLDHLRRLEEFDKIKRFGYIGLNQLYQFDQLGRSRTLHRLNQFGTTRKRSLIHSRRDFRRLEMKAPRTEYGAEKAVAAKIMRCIA